MFPEVDTRKQNRKFYVFSYTFLAHRKNLNLSMTLKWQRNQNVKFWNNYIFIDHKIHKAEKFWHFINNLSRDVKTIETQLENKQNFPIGLFHALSSILPEQTFFQDLNLPVVKGVKTRRLCQRNLDKLALGFSYQKSYHSFIFTPVCDVIALQYKKRQQSYLPRVIYLPSHASVSVNKQTIHFIFSFLEFLS